MEAQFPDVRSMVAALKPSYPVYCLRPHVLRRSAQKFLELFPGRVLYAVKCNPHPQVLQELYEAGIRHFDTASLPIALSSHTSSTAAASIHRIPSMTGLRSGR